MAFHSDLRGNNDVYVINADGSGMRRISDHPGEDFDPEWMPDGRLLFASDRDGDENIWMMDLETGALRQLTRYDGGRTGGPTPAADGQRIGTDPRSMAPHGDDVRTLGSTDGDNQDPQFSQDGSRLVWVTDRHGNWEIYEADVEGGNEQRVSHTPQDLRHPDLFLPSAR